MLHSRINEKVRSDSWLWARPKLYRKSSRHTIVDWGILGRIMWMRLKRNSRRYSDWDEATTGYPMAFYWSFAIQQNQEVDCSQPIVLRVSRSHQVEYISISLAEKLQKHFEKTDPERKLKILVQIKTSEEESSSPII